MPINRNELPENENNFEPVPAGNYDVQIKSGEVKTTKDGTGKYIAVGYQILGPTHQNRIVFGNFNIQNKSADAERIGRSQLGDLLTAINLDVIQDTDQLIGKILTIKVKIRPAKGEYEASNDVVGWYASKGSSMPTGSIPKTPATPIQSEAPKAPWL